MMSYLDGRLPFDINDFTAHSPKANEAHIEVLDSSAASTKDNDIDDFFKTLMHDTYTPAIPPQPVPAVVSSGNYYSSSFGGQSSSGYDQFNQYESGNVSFGGGDSNVQSSYNQSYANSFNTSIPQPPLPPTSNRQDNWGDMDMSWNSSAQDASFNQSIDAPRSPPHYERKGVNTNVIEYIEPGVDDSHLAGSGDVDHRQLILPMNGLNALGAKDRGRLSDVDHRNLISLTGSPKLTDKEANGSQADAMVFYLDFLFFRLFVLTLQCTF